MYWQHAGLQGAVLPGINDWHYREPVTIKRTDMGLLVVKREQVGWSEQIQQIVGPFPDGPVALLGLPYIESTLLPGDSATFIPKDDGWEMV
jgi:hypothetical protein